MSELIIDKLAVEVSGKQILSDVSLAIRSGEVHAIMGPNGAGKSTLSNAIMGRSGYNVTSGTASLDGIDLLSLETFQRAKAGLFYVMQAPTEVPGVRMEDMLNASLISAGAGITDMPAALAAEAASIGFDVALLDRSLNVDLSGGEKKRSETIQMSVLKPKIAIIDELDSGLDVDGLRTVAARVEQLTNDGLGVLVITHFPRLLTELRADKVHVLAQGRIMTTGGPELATELEKTGYGAYAEPKSAAKRPEIDDPFFM